MKYALATSALVAAVAAQSCLETVSYKFEVTQINATESTSSKRNLNKRVTTCTNSPVSTLNKGVLIDQDGSQGSILQDTAAQNTQFQYDPAAQTQPNALITGFCINSNNTLSHPTGNGGPSAVFYNCQSTSNGKTESKLYGDGSLGSGPPALCSEVYLEVVQCEGGVANEAVHNAGGGTQTTGGQAATESLTATASSSEATTTPASSAASAPATTGATTPAVAPAPYPAGNATNPAASGSGTGSATTAPTTATTSAPATFTPGSGANAFAVGSQLLAGVAAIGALALF